MVKIKNNTHHTKFVGLNKEPMSLSCIAEVAKDITTLKSYLAVSLRLNIHLLHDPAIPLLGIYPREMKTYVLKNTYVRMFITVIFVIAKNWRQPKCLSSGEWNKQMWHIHTIVLSNKKNKLLIHKITLINSKNIMLNKVLAKRACRSNPAHHLLCK